MRNAGFFGSLNGFGTVSIEIFGINMGMGVDHKKGFAIFNRVYIL
jgi:hypothetical protein